MTHKKIIFSCFFLSVLLVSIPSAASEPHPFYIGVTGGYGATTWGNLVPKEMNYALSTSVPENVSEGGAVWGVFAGYQFIPAFAVEASYMHYPTANLSFSDMSLFAYQYDRTEFSTHAERVALVGKIMLTIPHTQIKAYSSFGAAEVHRDDVILNRWRLSPTFGAGLNYDITPHVVTELGTEYVAGYGQSELDPAKHFIPFLYSVFLRVAYRF